MFPPPRAAGLNLDKIQCDGYGFQIELTNKLWRQGFKVVEVPIIFTERTQGQSKMAGGIVNEAFWLVWRLWLQNGLRRSPREKTIRLTAQKDLPNAERELDCQHDYFNRRHEPSGQQHAQSRRAIEKFTPN
jgi:hypothetical protein